MKPMTKNNIQCTLTDAELSAKADQWIDELIASGGKSFTMQVPARPNKDTDLIFAELNNRFKAMLQSKERAEKIAKEHSDLNLALAAMLNGYQNLSMYQKGWFTVPKDLIDAYTKMVLECDKQGKEVENGQ
jgi:hypothetical protein